MFLLYSLTNMKQPPPWKRPSPPGKMKSSKLSAEQVAAARERAEKAGRRYPNLVDNMWAAKHFAAAQAANADEKSGPSPLK